MVVAKILQKNTMLVQSYGKVVPRAQKVRKLIFLFHSTGWVNAALKEQNN
jgi:hypothetical protein